MADLPHKPRGEADIDIEFLGENDEPVGTVTARLGKVKIVSEGLFISTNEIWFTAPRKITIHAWRVWIGDHEMYAKLPSPPTIDEGDIYVLRNITIHTKIVGGIDFGPNGGGGGRPVKPRPKIKQDEKL